MNVLSLFDGISCARVALDRAGIEVNAYMSAEIDKNAIKVSEKNYPDIIRVGSVVDLSVEGEIDLLIGGSPCQDLSIAKKDRKGLEGNRSGLFWQYVRIMKECKPKWFVLENVASMPKADRDIITKEMGVEPVLFNASLVSAQSRKRLFWTNIPFQLPEDKGILLKHILQPDGEVDERMVVKGGKSACIDANYHKGSSVEHAIKKKVRTMVKVGYIGEGEQYGQGGQAHRVYSTEGKTPTLSSGPALVKEEARIRKLTPIECERLQGLPDNYTEGVATTHRYKCLGNAFNVDVVAHILKGMV
jgi:DNA (cytosine-5)-methyltransferase 3A